MPYKMSSLWVKWRNKLTTHRWIELNRRYIKSNQIDSSLSQIAQLYSSPCCWFPCLDKPDSHSIYNSKVAAIRPFWVPLDNIRVMVIVCRLRGNIIRIALCWIVWHNVHSQQHAYVSSSYRFNRLKLRRIHNILIETYDHLNSNAAGDLEWPSVGDHDLEQAIFNSRHQFRTNV